MPGQFIDWNAPSLQGSLPKLPNSLPHGFLAPPEPVRELVAREKAKFPPHLFTPAAEERILNDWTLQYYFDYLGYEVLYRPTAQGPEVLAVGFDEILALTKTMPLADQLQLKTWQPG